MDWILGLDGGGTGCRVVLADRAGRIVGRGTSGPANIMSDRDGARASIMTAANAAMNGKPASSIAACLGLAGANISGARDWLAPTLPFGRCRVVHDAVTSVAGALGPTDGIVAAIGTGSVFSRQIAGEVVSIGGWGAVLGDEASGAWLGKRFLAHALRAHDGLAPESPLSCAVLDDLGGPAGAVAFARTASGADFAALVPRIAGNADDPAAQAVLDAGTAEIAAAVTHLQPAHGPALPVVFIGGLGPLYAQRLSGRWPQAEAQGTALDGALRLAEALAAEAVL